MQGGIDPALPGTAYLELARAVKRGAPGLHLHAYSPMEVVNGAARMGVSIEEFLLEAKAAGVDSLPGTAAEILDDEVRWVLTKGKLPTAQWVEVVTTAHRVGLPTTSTMMYGHVDAPHHWLGPPAAARRAAGPQRRVHRVRAAAVRAHERAALPRRGGPAGADRARQPGRARGRAAAAARPDRPRAVQLGQARPGAVPPGARRRGRRPRRHADGGDHQPDGRLAARLAASRSRTSRRWCRAAGRSPRQRTTGYGEVGAERHAAARVERGLLPLV